MRKLKILVVTLAMTLVFAAPAFATVLGDTEVNAGPEATEIRLDLEFLSEAEVEAGALEFGIGSSD